MTYNPYEEKRRTETIARLYKENQNLAKQNIDLKNQVKKLNTQVDLQSQLITVLQTNDNIYKKHAKQAKIAIMGWAHYLEDIMDSIDTERSSPNFFHIKDDPERNRGIYVKQIIYLKDWESYYKDPYSVEKDTLRRMIPNRV